MAVYQILVKPFHGRTLCLQIPSPTISGEALKRHLAARAGFPLHSARLVSGSREIADDTLLFASAEDGSFPSCALLLRLRGGKGGFGSLLRGAATKAGQKKTNNFDACRDMSGRRLRHVNAEKKLEEWKAEAEERRLEKLAEQFLRQKAKEVKKSSTIEVDKYLKKYKEDAERCVEEVEESVRLSFQLYKESKRKVLPSSGPASKRLKIWLGKKKVEESDSDGDDDIDEEDKFGDNEDQESIVLDEGNCSNGFDKAEEKSSVLGSAAGSQSDGECFGAGSNQRNSEKINGSSDLESLEAVQGSGCGDSNAESEVEMGTTEVDVQSSAAPCLEKVLEPNGSTSEMDSNVQIVFMYNTSEAKPVEIAVMETSALSMEEQLDLDKYNSAAELEVLGMERLKTELQVCGLKCGGTLQERASRLFMLKTIPLERLPKKLLARPVLGGN